MNGKTIGLLVGAAGLAYWLSTKAYNLKEAISKLSATNPRIKASFTALTLSLNVKIDVVNPSSADIPFEYYAGTINYAGSEVAKFNYNYQGRRVIIPQRGLITLDFVVNVSNLQTLWKLKAIIQSLIQGNKNIDSKFYVTSAIYAGGFDVPVNFVYDMRQQAVVSGVQNVNPFEYVV